ncbi:MAG: MOSC domain-containing protein [Phaeodactylibacter sp.]|uniref:MOSC domain-containing protein n=1 Tax=Phaeodactylibacter sp. TaxID=1940289 RepID=UPI0032EACDCD
MKFPNLKELQSYVPQTGRISWLGKRPEKRSPLVPCEAIRITPDGGIEGDHYSRKGGKRQVTLIQEEHLHAVGAMLGQDGIDPALTRRNLVVSGINLLSLLKRQVQIGAEVVLEVTGHCHPCSRMEDNLGDGGYSAMRGHGGVTASVVKGGVIRLGDTVCVFESKTNPNA